MSGTSWSRSQVNGHAVRKVVISSGLVTTFAGVVGVAGHADGVGTTATFSGPYGVALNAAGTVALVVRHSLRLAGLGGPVKHVSPHARRATMVTAQFD